MTRKDKLNEEKLSPNKYQINRVLDYTNAMNASAAKIDLIYEMASEGDLPIELAQKMLDVQVKLIEQYWYEVKGYLHIAE
jgi:hypothetical protein